jgi:putative ABC transport system permease protein
MERASEIGVRKAFGASSMTLVGQFIIENVLLTIVGGLIGFVFSYVVLQYFNSTGWITYAQLELNYRVFLYGFIMMIFFGIISGVYPAWRMSRLHPVQALKGGVK